MTNEHRNEPPAPRYSTGCAYCGELDWGPRHKDTCDAPCGACGERYQTNGVRHTCLWRPPYGRH